MHDLSRLLADDTAIERDIHAILSRLVQLLAARMQMRREKPDAAQRIAEEQAAADGLAALQSMLVLGCEQRIALRERIDAAQAAMPPQPRTLQ